MTDINKNDLVGEWWIEPLGSESMNWLEATSRAIDGLRPLLIKPFTNTITGYYVSRKKISELLSVVRFYPFVKKEHADIVSKEIDKFIQDSHVIKHGSKFQSPRIQPLADDYGGRQFEERFRRFLALNTYITLELIESDIELARRLAITSFYWVYLIDKQFRNHLEPSFERYSPYYVSLSNVQRTNFWSDFELDPKDGTYWAHFFENLAYGFLWIPRRVINGYKYSIEEINNFFQGDYKLPPDWTVPS